MKTTKTTLLLVLALALVATASPAAAQADFSKFVAIGASVGLIGALVYFVAMEIGLSGLLAALLAG